MHVSIRLIRRSDLDLITMHLGGISLQKIARKAIYAYVRGESFSVIAEPVPRIPLEKACQKMITAPGYRLGSEIKRFVPIRLDLNISDELSCSLITSARSAYGSTLIKQLIRMSLLNLPVSPLLLSPEDLAEWESAFRRRSAHEERNQRTIEKIVTREKDIFMTLIEKEKSAGRSDVFIAGRDGKLVALTKKYEPVETKKIIPGAPEIMESRKPQEETSPPAAREQDLGEEDLLSQMLDLGELVLS